MRYQEATAVIAAPIAQLERRLSNVETWSDFLVGLDDVQTLGHERYRFRLNDRGDRREVTTCVRHLSASHRYTWRALEGPQYTGSIDLAPVDDRHTSVKLCMSSHPGTLSAGLAEMVMPRMAQAAYDLRRLEESVLAPH